MRELVADVVALLDDAGLATAHVVGHDWGGAVAWATAPHAAPRVRSLTVLSTPHPSAFTGSMLTSTQALKSWYMAFFQLPAVPELVIGRDLAGWLRRSGLPRPMAERFARRMREPGALKAALNWYRALPASLAARIPRVRVPTTYAWGRRDFALGRRAAELTAQFVTAAYRFESLDAGHWLPETRPDQVAALVIDQVRAV